MYKGIATGKNLCYGKKGEVVFVPNIHMRYAEKNDIVRNLKYDGSGRLVIRDCATGKEIR